MAYNDFKVTQSAIFKDVITVEPDVYWDNRGNIYTSFKKEVYDQFIPGSLKFEHDKMAQSKFNVLRGLHGDHKTWKLVSCVFGEIHEVIVDMRADSPTYKKWEAFSLNSDKYSQLLIPPGFVNGYYVKSEVAIFHYKLAYDGRYLDADEQMTIKWDSKDLAIKWPCTAPFLQDRDNI